jgi:hypothetical protein
LPSSWRNDVDCALRPTKQARAFFLKKRSKRLLFLRRPDVAGHGRRVAAGADLKVFWFFSSEKNILSSTRPILLDFSSDSLSGAAMPSATSCGTP